MLVSKVHHMPIESGILIAAILIVLAVDFHPELSRVWSEPHGLDHIAPFELSRFLGKQGFEFLGGSVAEG